MLRAAAKVRQYPKNSFDINQRLAILVYKVLKKGTNKAELCFHATNHSVGDSFLKCLIANISSKNKTLSPASQGGFTYQGIYFQYGVLCYFAIPGDSVKT